MGGEDIAGGHRLSGLGERKSVLLHQQTDAFQGQLDSFAEELADGNERVEAVGSMTRDGAVILMLDLTDALESVTDATEGLTAGGAGL